MKKLIAVAAILSVMFLGAGTSQALMGVPDAVPGEDILVPFFIVSMPGFGSDNTLITITDVGGAACASDDFHLRLYDVHSVEQYNEWFGMTKNDVYVMDAQTLINTMAPGALLPVPIGRAALEVDLDGDGTNDHWVGYIHFERNPAEAAAGNNFISHVYQVSVADGMVAGYTGVSLETSDDRIDDYLEAYSGNGVDFVGLEALSANALLVAEQILTGDAPRPAAEFHLLPRVYLADANSTNILIIWTDVEGAPVNVVPPGVLHINFYDEDENAISSSFVIPDELNFIDVKDIYPAGLTNVAPAAYAAGWIDIQTTYTDVTWGGVDGSGGERLWLGYSLQRAMMAGGTTLDVILEAHRAAISFEPSP